MWWSAIPHASSLAELLVYMFGLEFFMSLFSMSFHCFNVIFLAFIFLFNLFIHFLCFSMITSLLFTFLSIDLFYLNVLIPLLIGCVRFHDFYNKQLNIYFLDESIIKNWYWLQVLDSMSYLDEMTHVWSILWMIDGVNMWIFKYENCI